MDQQKPDCDTCLNQYQGADFHKRCRVHSSGMRCSYAAADGCRHYEPDDGVITVNLCDCMGRGDSGN